MEKEEELRVRDWLGKIKKAVQQERTRARTEGRPFNAPLIEELVGKAQKAILATNSNK